MNVSKRRRRWIVIAATSGIMSCLLIGLFILSWWDSRAHADETLLTYGTQKTSPGKWTMHCSGIEFLLNYRPMIVWGLFFKEDGEWVDSGISVGWNVLPFRATRDSITGPWK